MTITRTVTVSIVCPFCRNEHFVTVGEEGFERWQKGELAQNVFPYLSATQREQLITNVCPDCQAKLFGEDPEEDEDIDISDFEDEGDDISACMAESLAFTGQWW